MCLIEVVTDKDDCSKELLEVRGCALLCDCLSLDMMHKMLMFHLPTVFKPLVLCCSGAPALLTRMRGRPTHSNQISTEGGLQRPLIACGALVCGQLNLTETDCSRT